MHNEPHQLAGKTVKIKTEANGIGGNEIRIEDWQDRVFGKSWMNCDGNPAALTYAMRTGFSKKISVPTNNECIYGKIGSFGHIVHVCELEELP